MDDREPYGRLVRETWVAWALEQPDPKPSWLVPWEGLGAADREVDMRIGSAVAARAVADAGGEAASARTDRDRMRMERGAMASHLPAVRDALSSAVADARYEAQAKPYRAALEALEAGQQERDHPRVVVDLNVRVRKHETYSGFEDVAGADPAALRHGDRVLAVEVEDGICSDAIVTAVDLERHLVYLVPDWSAWRDDPAITGSGQEPLSATCTGPGCGEQFADSETGEYLFASRERMERLLYADGWAADPVLCPACQEEAGDRG